MTGLQNRRAFFVALEFEAERAKRYARPLSIIFLDLDNFKQINDTRGHDAGDEALRTTAKVMLNILRSNDRVTRLGGDEFVILLPEIGYNEAVGAGHKIFALVNKALREFLPVTCSIGVAWFKDVDRTFPEMLKEAD